MANDKDLAAAELQRRGVDPFYIFSNSPLLESALAMGTGAASSILGGLVGLAGLPFGPNAAGNAVRRTQDALTYQPRSQQAREGLGAVAKLYQPIEDAKQGFGDATLDKTGSPLMATLAYSTPEILEAALGLRAAKYIPGNQYDVGSIGNQSTGMGRKERGIFAGVKAKNADLEQLKAAQELANRGIDRKAIWYQTGWYQGGDGQWRWEIDDSGFSLDPNKPKPSEYGFKTARGDVFRHGNLKGSYPELFGENMKVSFDSSLKDGGTYRSIRDYGLGSPHQDFISLRDPAKPKTDYPEVIRSLKKRLDEWSQPDYVESYAKDFDLSLADAKAEIAEDISFYNEKIKKAEEYNGEIVFRKGSKPTALHELQHAIQDREGFAAGGSPDQFKVTESKMTPLEQYRRLAGEAESRNVETRMDWTPEKRREIAPWESLDVPEDELIYRTR